MLYPIAIEKTMFEGKPVYGVVVPDLLGCIAVGDSYQEAYDNVIEAIGLHLESMNEDNEEIPFPKTIDDYIYHIDYQGMIWATVEIDLSPYMGKVEKVNITLPQSLLHKIDQKILGNKSYYRSRSHYLAELAFRDLSSSHSF